MTNICPVHQKEFVLRPAGVSKKTGQPYNAFSACPEFGCRQKPGQSITPAPISSPRGNFDATGVSYVGATFEPKLSVRNYEKEAYAKCCSIWASADREAGMAIADIQTCIVEGAYWNLFKTINADADKRFATGMDKARAIFKPETPTEDSVDVDQIPF